MTEERVGGAGVVAVAMGEDELPIVLPADLRDRLSELTGREVRVVLGNALGDGLGDGLGNVDILVTGWGCPPLTEAVLDGAPRLGIVVHAAGSVKQLATDAVWERGIVVSSAAEANAGPVADFTLAAVGLAAKGALSAAAAYAGGRWPAFRDRHGADGRTVGVLGASRIGRRVITGLRASTAGYRVLLYDPYVTDEEAARLGAERVHRLADLCGASGIVTIHAPATPETHRMLDAAHLALIPDGGTVINTARGSLVDTEALERECGMGRLNAWLDVTDPEPLKKGHALLRLPNVLVTPHIAGAQGSEGRRLGAYAVEEAGRWARGEPLLGAVERAGLGRLA
ncbi:hydroxyacid dehydrogenase [Streptomyces sp. URMC 124]|uniref:hydroxyacid dehydrogenase n=1 Tax=Streptomyces sp. URMC 124 TaxID=3423405 RepID=UPI003F198F38